jgi:hypothetical protein
MKSAIHQTVALISSTAQRGYRFQQMTASVLAVDDVKRNGKRVIGYGESRPLCAKRMLRERCSASWAPIPRRFSTMPRASTRTASGRA